MVLSIITAGTPPLAGTPPRQVHPPEQVHPPAQVHPPGKVHTSQGRYTPRTGTPPAGTPPGAVHAGRYGQRADGTHPTQMYSCLFIQKQINN